VLWDKPRRLLHHHRTLTCKFRVTTFTVGRRRFRRWLSHLSHVDVLSRTAMNETKTETTRQVTPLPA
jgi:hypothetical protein